MKYCITALVTVGCDTEVEADSKEEAIRLAQERNLAEIYHSGSDPLDETWHMDNDGLPYEISVVES